MNTPELVAINRNPDDDVTWKELANMHALAIVGQRATIAELVAALRGLVGTQLTRDLCPFGVAYVGPLEPTCDCTYHMTARAARTALAKVAK